MEVDLISYKKREGTDLASSNFPTEVRYTLQNPTGQKLTLFYALSTACRPRADPTSADPPPPGNLWSGCKLNGTVSAADPETGHQSLQIEPPVWISPSVPWRFVKNGSTMEEQYGNGTLKAQINTYLDQITVTNFRPGPCTLTLNGIEEEIRNSRNSEYSNSSTREESNDQLKKNWEDFNDQLNHPVEFIREEETGLDWPVDGGGIPIDMKRFCRGTLKYKGLSGIFTNRQQQNTVDLGVTVMFMTSSKVDPDS